MLIVEREKEKKHRSEERKMNIYISSGKKSMKIIDK